MAAYIFGKDEERVQFSHGAFKQIITFKGENV
jgi:hypothetical protein